MVKPASVGILLLLFISILSPYTSIYGDISPHERPDTASTELDPASLLSFYVLLLRATLGIENLNLTSLLPLFKYIGLPNEIIYIVNRLNSLILKVYNDINQTETLLKRAELLIKFEVYDEAYETLDEARFYLYSANKTLSEVELAINELKSRLGKYIVNPNDPRLIKASEEIRDLINKLHDLINELLSRLYKLSYETESGISEQAPWLLTTFISIHTNITKVKVGHDIEVYGKLYCAKNPLSHRKVDIISPFANLSVITDEDGYYIATIHVSNYYQPKATIDVFYKPTGEDRNHFRSTHNKTTINILYIKTRLIVDAPRFIYPGLPAYISVLIFPWFSNISRKVAIYFDNETLFIGYVNSSRSSFKLFINDTTVIGPHVLKVYVYPHGEYSDAMYTSILTVTYKGIIFTVDVNNSFVVYPFGKVNLHGYAMDVDGNLLVNETIEVKILDRVYLLRTDLNGRFSISVDAPFVFGDCYITVTFKPVEKWYPVVSKQVKIIVINTISSIIVIVFLIGAFFFFRRYPIKLPKIPIPAQKPKPYVTYKPKYVATTSKVDAVKSFIDKWVIFKGIGKIIPIYKAVIKKISGIVGLPQPSDTIREYYKRVEPHIKPVKDEFWKLTLYTEYELYSGKSVKESMVKEAIKLKEAILRVFRR